METHGNTVCMEMACVHSHQVPCGSSMLATPPWKGTSPPLPANDPTKLVVSQPARVMVIRAHFGVPAILVECPARPHHLPGLEGQEGDGHAVGPQFKA